MKLTERKKAILRAIINDYIDTAEPVGSKAVASRPELGLSPATIRNEMSELEELGFLEKTHTSSGRVPSTSGYRLYVDELMEMHDLPPSIVNAANELLNLKVKELDKLISEASQLISNLTHYAAVAVTPTFDKMSIRTFEIVRVDDITFVIVVVASNGVVKNKLVKTSSPVSQNEVELLTYVLNQTLTGISLDMINEQRFDIVKRAAGITALLSPIAEYLAELIREFTDSKYFLEGASKLLNFPEYSDVNKAREIMDFISDKHSMELIKPELYDDGIKIAIGTENGQNPLSDSSMIYATYSIGKLGHGVIGIVGPRRMDYANISAQLSLFAKALSRLIAESFDELSDNKLEDNNGRKIHE